MKTFNSWFYFKSSDGPLVTSADLSMAQYTVETLVLAVVAASFAALLVGFASGYFCGRKCHKDDDDNLPYPDTEYEYFEQRQNVNAWVFYVFHLFIFDENKLNVLH